MNLNVQHFFDTATSTLSYVVWDADTSDAVIIDPVLDFDPVNLKFSEDSLTQLLDFVSDNGLTVRHVLETHILETTFMDGKLKRQLKLQENMLLKL